MKRLIALLLCLMLLSGCVGTPPAETTPTPSPTPRTQPLPAQTVVEVVGTETRTVELEGQGGLETVTMTEVIGSFASMGGPRFRLFADTARYQINDAGGCCYLTLRTGMSGDVYAELGFRPGETAESLADGILAEYGTILASEDLGKEKLGAYRVHHVQGDTIQNVFDVYLLDTHGGCLTMVISSTAQTQHHRTRLLTTLQTLELL